MSRAERLLLLATGAMGGLTASRVLHAEWLPALSDALALGLLSLAAYVIYRKNHPEGE